MQTIIEKAGERFIVDQVIEKNALWSIEIIFSHNAETKVHRIRNVETKTLMQFRADIFAVGMMFPVDPGHWIIVHPNNIVSIDVYKQSKRFKEF